MMAERILAAIGLAVCLALIVRMLLPAPQQRRFDAAARRLWFAIKVKAIVIWRWRRIRRDARQAAADAINRASGQPGERRRGDDGQWKGNVYEAKTFRKPRKPH